MSMNTKNPLEERILEDFRQLPEELREKFLSLIRNLKAESVSQGAKASQKHIWNKADEEFFEALRQRHFRIDENIDIDRLMQDLNNGLS